VFHYWESVNQGVILEESGFRVMSHKYVTPAAKTGPAGGVVPIAPRVGEILHPGRQNEGPAQVARNKIYRGRCGRLPYCWRAGSDCVGITWRRKVFPDPNRSSGGSIEVCPIDALRYRRARGFPRAWSDAVNARVRRSAVFFMLALLGFNKNFT